MSLLQEELAAFVAAHGFREKGPLCVGLIVTDHARSRGLPLNSEHLLTEGGGQVLGLGRSAVQAILARHNITKILASEGGRTSRGSLGNMRQLVALLNSLHDRGIADLEAVEAFWIERVHEFFAAKPFKIRQDASRSLRCVIRDLISQAEERQRNSPGTHYAGAVMQHLVGAKLECALGPGQVHHNCFSTSDAQTGRAGDFVIGDVAVHVTTSPGEAVISRCRENLDTGMRPILITGQRGLSAAEVLAENQAAAERIDMFEVEQFVSLDLHEQAIFTAAGRKIALETLVARYNQIVEECETDPSLRIELR